MERRPAALPCTAFIWGYALLQHKTSGEMEWSKLELFQRSVLSVYQSLSVCLSLSVSVSLLLFFLLTIVHPFVE